MVLKPKEVETWDDLPDTLYDDEETYSLVEIREKGMAMEGAMRSFVDCSKGGRLDNITLWDITATFKQILGDYDNQERKD